MGQGADKLVAGGQGHESDNYKLGNVGQILRVIQLPLDHLEISNTHNYKNEFIIDIKFL